MERDTYKTSLKTEVLKKTERIASALYFITSFFDLQEPLRWRLRELSTVLVSSDLQDKTNRLREILSLIVVARNADMISDTNFDILTKEISILEDSTTDHKEVHNLLNSPNEDPKRTFSYIGQNTIKDRKYLSNKPQGTSYKTNVPKDSNVVSMKKNQRQSIILDIIKNKKEVMIKDISTEIKDCSDKTIQRDLLSMVQSGLLKKIGEKRWSRYSLARP